MDASLSTLVSIYLLLLAFLVTMHSVSNLQLAKVGAAFHSVNSTFSGSEGELSDKAIKLEDLTIYEEAYRTRGGNQPFYDQAAFVLQSQMTLEGLSFSDLGNGLSTHLPSNLMFIGVSELVRPTFEPFIHEMALLASESGSNELQELEFVFHYGRGEDGKRVSNPAADLNLALIRADGLARKLIELGFPQESFTVGIGEGVQNQVEIAFRSRNKNDAQLDFLDIGQKMEGQ